jgi:hypothetical protein
VLGGQMRCNGLEICAAAGLASGTVHPILARLERLGWLESRWEDIDPARVAAPSGATTSSVRTVLSKPDTPWLLPVPHCRDSWAPARPRAQRRCR